MCTNWLYARDKDDFAKRVWAIVMPVRCTQAEKMCIACLPQAARLPLVWLYPRPRKRAHVNKCSIQAQQR